MSLAAELVIRHRFTAQEYRQMAEAGVFAEDERLELVEGEILEMSPIGPRHIEAVIALTALVFRQLAERYDVSLPDASRDRSLGRAPAGPHAAAARIASRAGSPAVRTRRSWWRWPTLPCATTVT